MGELALFLPCPKPSVQSALAECVDKELKERLKGAATRKAVQAGGSDEQLRQQFVVAVKEDRKPQVCNV